MRGRLFYFVLLCVSMALFCISCEGETNTNRAGLEGRWEITKGFRNQNPTETLSGTYFQFNADGKMITNLPVGPEDLVDFELHDKTIRQKSSPPIEYTIASLTDTALVLNMELRGMQFEMQFKRVIPPPVPIDTLDTETEEEYSIPPSDSTRE